MVEHADIIDTELLHEPKGIIESEEGEVYISDNDDQGTNPTGHWGRLPVSSLDFEPPTTASESYTDFSLPVTLTNTIIGTPTGVVTEAVNFSAVNQNLLELYTAVNNLLTRLAIVEGNLSKVQALLTNIDSGLKSTGFLVEEEQ